MGGIGLGLSLEVVPQERVVSWQVQLKKCVLKSWSPKPGFTTVVSKGRFHFHFTGFLKSQSGLINWIIKKI